MSRPLIPPFPDTPLVREATVLSAHAHTLSLFHHSVRVFVLGRDVARRRGLRFDEEGLLLAALFHDLGLSAPHRDPTRGFMEVGADLLQGLLGAAGEPGRAAALAEAIDVHAQLFPRWGLGAEAGLLHVGNVIDVTGLRSREVEPGLIQELERAFPRLSLDQEGPRALRAALGSLRSVVRLLLPPRRRRPRRAGGAPRPAGGLPALPIRPGG